MYLGPSPNHARSVHMILSLQTGHVSPQFHVYFDDMFETIREPMGVSQSYWQSKTGIQSITAQHGRSRANTHTNSHIRSSVSIYGPEEDRTNHTSEPRSTGEQTVNDPPSFRTDPNSQVIEEETVLDTNPDHVKLESVVVEQQEENDSNPGENMTLGNDTVSAPCLWSRRHKPMARLHEYMGTLQSMTCLNEALHQEDLTFLEGMDSPLCFMSPKSDTLYFDQAMQVEDKEKFKEAMLKEVATRFKCKHWELIAIQEVPASTKLLDSVWVMQRKRCISTGKIYKYKARLNAHGGQQVHGIHYWDTYAPVITWFAIRLMLTLVLLHKWSMLTVDFVLASPQADVDSEIYMKLPGGINFGPNISRLYHVLKLIKNIYGLKQAG